MMEPELTFVAILDELEDNHFIRLPILRALYQARSIIYEAKNWAILESKLSTFYQELKRLCQKGDGNALALSAYFYQFGIHVDEDYNLARQLCDKAIQQHHSFASYNMALMYFHGRGLKRNIKKSIERLEKANEQGCVNAAYYLGKIYLRGLGVEKNIDKAITLLNFACENKYTPAMILLAHEYKLGHHTQKSVPDAIRLLKQAIELGDGEAMNELGMLYQARAYQLDHSRGSDDGLAYYRKAEKKYKLAADFGSGAGMYHFAFMTKYLSKKQRPQDRDSIIISEIFGNTIYFPYLNQAYKLGIIEASYPLAKAYRNGNGCVADPTKALKHFLIAADDGNIDAMVQVAESYATGTGCDKDLAKALAYYHKAAEKGDEFALFQLSDYYKEGLGTDVDLFKAIQCYEDSFRIQCQKHPLLSWCPLSIPAYPMDTYQISNDAFDIDRLLDALWPNLLAGKTFSNNTVHLLKGLGQPSIMKRLRETFRPYSNFSKQTKLLTILTNPNHGFYQCLTTETRKLIRQEIDYQTNVQAILSPEPERDTSDSLTLPPEISEEIVDLIQSPPIAKTPPDRGSNRSILGQFFFKPAPQHQAVSHPQADHTWNNSL